MLKNESEQCIESTTYQIFPVKVLPVCCLAQLLYLLIVLF